MRLFFDILRQEIPSYDFRGLDFDRTEDAINIAELVAVDLGFSEDSDWVGSQVQVRNVVGETLFAVPILVAA